jgi:chemotaxis protein MotB
MAEVEQPIIIKKITKVEGGHHGGAWKVAYADFVTAMMAFFLLLWLLASTSEGKLEAIAEYFSPTIGLKDALGIGFKGGQTDILEDGTKRENTSRPSIIAGQPPQGIKIGEPKKKAIVESPEGEQMLFEKAASSINQAIADDDATKSLGENVMMEQKPEGLSVQLMDTDKEPIFKTGSTSLTESGERLLSKITKTLEDVPNHISITGHTDGTPFNRLRNYSNWELSADRANSARRFMIKVGLDAAQVGKVQGRADKELLYIHNPKDPRNRRLEIILLKGGHMQIAPTDKPDAMGAYPLDDRGRDLLKFEQAPQQEPLKSGEKPKSEFKEDLKPVTIKPEIDETQEELGNDSVIEFSP